MKDLPKLQVSLSADPWTTTYTKTRYSPVKPGTTHRELGLGAPVPKPSSRVA